MSSIATSRSWSAWDSRPRKVEGGIGISQLEERDAGKNTAKPFKIAAIVAAVLLGVLSFSLVSLATAWFGIEERAGHEVHDLSWGILGGLVLTGALVVQIKDSTGKIATMQAFVLTVVVMGVVLTIADPSPLILVFLGVTALLVYLHPARSRLMEVGDGWQPFLAGLAILGAIPLVIYALDQIDIQRLDLNDPHWEEGHFGQMAAWAVVMPALGLLTARRTPGWIWVARGAALGTSLMGLISLIYPDNVSSLGTAWGTATIVGALVFAAAAEMEARSGRGEAAAERVTASSDPP